MSESVYIETTIPSYLTARPYDELITLARQHMTIEWWESRRQIYDIYISAVVIAEASSGHPEAAERRLKAIDGINQLAITDDCNILSRKILA